MAMLLFTFGKKIAINKPQIGIKISDVIARGKAPKLRRADRMEQSHSTKLRFEIATPPAAACDDILNSSISIRVYINKLRTDNVR